MVLPDAASNVEVVRFTVIFVGPGGLAPLAIRAIASCVTDQVNEPLVDGAVESAA